MFVSDHAILLFLLYPIIVLPSRNVVFSLFFFSVHFVSVWIRTFNHHLINNFYIHSQWTDLPSNDTKYVVGIVGTYICSIYGRYTITGAAGEGKLNQRNKLNDDQRTSTDRRANCVVHYKVYNILKALFCVCQLRMRNYVFIPTLEIQTEHIL